MTVFLEFLCSWLAGNILNAGLSAASRALPSAIDSLEANPASFGWDGDLGDYERGILQALHKTRQSGFRRFLSALTRQTNSRPIAVVGPSGAGKSHVSVRLAGKEPKESLVMSDSTERERLVSGLRGSMILTPPGSVLHGGAEFFRVLRGKRPPQVICIVVAGGFHATNDAQFAGNFTRPQSQREDVAGDLDGFLEQCKREEVAYVGNLVEVSSAEPPRHRIPSVITVVNKRDLWQARLDAARTLARYAENRSGYARIVVQARAVWGLDSPSVHDVFPCFMNGGGFLPQPSTHALALPQAQAQADAMILRALVYYRYTQGANRG